MHPTPAPEINALPLELLSGVQKILGAQFVGMYLYGSLAAGDADQDSDIDFVVVTAGQVDEETFAALQALHARIGAMNSKWALELEGSYIPHGAMRRYDANAAPYPTLNEGKFHRARHESDWLFQRYSVREHGVILAGPAPKSLIDPVSPDDLRRAVIGVMHEWWEKKLNEPAHWKRRGYQAYGVLSMCRAPYTIQFGKIVSKPVAARWAQESLDARWRPLIDRAWIGRRNPYSPADPEDVRETLGFIRYTLDRCERFESNSETTNLHEWWRNPEVDFGEGWTCSGDGKARLLFDVLWRKR